MATSSSSLPSPKKKAPWPLLVGGLAVILGLVFLVALAVARRSLRPLDAGADGWRVMEYREPPEPRARAHRERS